jgi:glycosyltransferase involved in cell wall biosynthesis
MVLEALPPATQPTPRLLVFSTLFPSPGNPQAGLFIRERMFRVGATIPIVVLAPLPWVPLQGFLRRWRPHWRPPAPRFEVQRGIEVYRPRFLSLPGIAKRLDGWFLALGSLGTARRLRRSFSFNVIDAHFAYPDGYAASLLGAWLRLPVTITLRGTEPRLALHPGIRKRMIRALSRADRIFAVAASLKRAAVELGIPDSKIRVIGNGVDLELFRPVPRSEARAALGLDSDDPVLITVGGLVERKGFHRVIACLPQLRRRFPSIRYLIVGGPGPEGDWTERLHRQVQTLDLESNVRFLGTMGPAALRVPLSAADVFVLATQNEGWANVFLEAMACGLPVVTTDVGGNAEVVARPELGRLVPPGDARALEAAIAEAVEAVWDHEAIRSYARANSWNERVAVLQGEFERIAADRARGKERP